MLKQVSIVLIVLISITSIEAYSQNCKKTATASDSSNAIPKVSTYIDKYAGDYTTFYHATMSDQNLSFDQKYRAVRAKIKSIETTIEEDLRSILESHKVTGSMYWECVKDYSGGKKICHDGCLFPPSRDYYLHTATSSRPGKDTDRKNYALWFYLEKAGKGTRSVTFSGEWHLRDEYIERKLNKDIDTIIAEIESRTQLSTDD